MVDVAGVLNNAMAQAASGASTYGTGIRNAMVFTSRLRQMQETVPAVADTASMQLLRSDVFDRRIESGSIILGPGDLVQDYVYEATIGKETFYSQGVLYTDYTYGSPEKKQANKWFRDRQVTSVQTRIAMALNPKSVKFEQGKRITKKDVRTGSVFFHFANEAGQNLDILTIKFVGNTGNLDRRATFDGEGSPNAQQGALNKFVVWHNLYLLSREPQLLSDHTENTITISYMSPLFTRNIDFHGFFNEVIDFEENAEKPHSRDYNFSFTVESSTPPLDSILDVVTNAVGDSVVESADGLILGPNATGFSP